MGILSVYDEVIENPTPISREYFTTRPKVNDMATWYTSDDPSFDAYMTYKIPIIKKGPKFCTTTFISVWDDQPIQVATIKFTYDFKNKVLFYNINKILSVYGNKNLPVHLLNFKSDCLKEIGELLDVDMLAITPGHIYKDVVSIKDFELIIDSTKSILVNAGYYLPGF